jgi:hypothetical protein
LGLKTIGSIVFGFRPQNMVGVLVGIGRGSGVIANLEAKQSHEDPIGVGCLGLKLSSWTILFLELSGLTKISKGVLRVV